MFVRIVIALAVTLTGCSSCDDDGTNWGFDEEVGEEVSQTDAGRVDASDEELRQPVLHDTIQTAMGCCDDLYIQFETKEPRCFEVHIRWSYSDSYLGDTHYPDVSVVPEDPNLALVGVTTASSRCTSSLLESGDLVSEVSGTIRNDDSSASLSAGFDLEVRIPGESSTRRLEADLGN